MLEALHMSLLELSLVALNIDYNNNNNKKVCEATSTFLAATAR